jgi:hypothetical protein
MQIKKEVSCSSLQVTWSYIQKPITIAPTLLDLINKFSKVGRHKNNIKKLVTFLFTSNLLYEKNVNKIIPFIIATIQYNT